MHLPSSIKVGTFNEYQEILTAREGLQQCFSTFRSGLLTVPDGVRGDVFYYELRLCRRTLLLR